ncbi:hypothetical protein Mag101_05145 [Microbulbifer agarilyticus]|uniref:Uncharacterized protein n=1 Tax=Microbulbifer agarilyticus TaxID=260552 RepID=A0A1Q2M362_9GAMM|nr:hypothetical protein [Microbulbifer agarilyticus]AQQ67096.1 hypothetical protein Mag101_05145 [Microbulbifer agarilyticus]
MIQALLASGIVFGLLKYFERGKDRGLDSFTSITFVLVPALLIFLATIGTGIAGIDQQFLIALVALYFIVPMLMLRLQFELSWRQSAQYGLLVLLVVITVDTLFYILLSATNA